jgi:hypothetical protein
MRILFIESHKFTEQVAWLNAEEAVWELENELLQNPDKGDKGRRFSQNPHEITGRGKSTGARVVYFHLRNRAVVFLFFLYTKSGQSDLTAEQKAALHQQTHYLK